MKNIALYNTSVGSTNKGDEIICESIERELDYILKEGFTVKYSTHTPPATIVQSLITRIRNSNINYSYGFIFGSNLLTNNMFRRKPLWNINLINAINIRNCVLVGVGSQGTNTRINKYTKMLYKKVLSKEYIHSVRDNFSRDLLESMGFKAINTGCATLWGLNEEHCRQIPRKKAPSVLFTLTDYKKDKEYDQILIDILQENYREIYFWVQGAKDLEYLREFKNIDRIKIIQPNLNALKQVLEKDIEFVGTRLHCGIYAMQHKKRATIVIVDNRAREMHKDFGLNCIERAKINDLDNIINSDIETKIGLDFSSIDRWKEQFS